MIRQLLLACLWLTLSAGAVAGVSGVVVPVSISPGFNSLSATPYTGFNSFYEQQLTPTQTYMQDVSDFLVSSGLQAAWGGTVVAGVDESWEATTANVVNRDGSGHPLPDANFTSMAAMVAHIKGNGQIAGMYRDGGQIGCQSEDWGAGTLASDLAFFSAQGFQAIKLDGCGITGASLSGRVIFGNAKATLEGLAVPYLDMYGYSSGSFNGYTQTWVYGPRTGTSWRFSTDVGQTGTPCTTSFDVGQGVMNNIWAAAHHPGTVGPYHFADADYLIAKDGTGSLSTNEAVTQMALTAIMGSPWVLGCDPRNLGATELATLKNADLISILKDSWVVGGKRVTGQVGGGGYGTANTFEIYYKRLSGNGKRAIAAVNLNSVATGSQTITIDPALVGVDTTQTYDFKNVLTGTTTTGHTGTFSTGSIAAHATAVFLLSNGTENNATCWATNPGGTGQIADGFAGGCAFTTDNNGSPAGGFPADGTTTTTATAIDTTGLTNPAAQGCYQKQRKGVISTDDAHEAGIEYIADNLVAGATYHYRVHLAEIDGNTAGQRLWNLTINTGAQSVPALTSEDIYADAGNAGNKAVIKEGNITADHGYLSFDFEPLSPPTGVPTTGCIEVIKQ